jgi:outer membrane protein OmpA-like peptidoglycan-associated protein/tetratricopeptide (TPR) repeat protein
MIKNKVLLAVLTLPFFSFSQLVTTENLKGKAKERFEVAIASRNIAFTDSVLQLVLAEKPNFIDGWEVLGKNLFFLKKYEEAAKTYEKVKVLKADYFGDINLRLAKCYVATEQYALARKLATEYLQLPYATNKSETEKIIANCNFAEEALKHPVPFDPVNLGTNINSAMNEAGPYLTADGKYLYFTREEEMLNFAQEDIYYAVKTGDHFGGANPVGDAINTLQNGEGSQSISASGKYLLFTSYDRPDGLGSADIYISRKAGNKWERANNLGSPINTPGWEGAPSLSADGRTLFFSSIRSGGYGQRDIWYSTLNENGTWATPINLGDSINTPFNDESPFIHPDGKTLYFSSNGHPGMGNYDLYVSHLLPNGKWSKAVNLGYPINTSGYEVSIFVTTDGSTAYYSSERKDSYGGMDIYKFMMPAVNRPNYTSYIEGNVFDSETRSAITANVQVFDLKTGKLFASASSDKANGSFITTLPSGKDYAVEVMKDGYLFYSHNISLKDATEGAPLEVDIPLHKISIGEKIVLNNVFFESDKFELKDESKAELNVVVKMLTQNPSLKIEIGGHTDNSGSEEKNKTLSTQRAKSVFDYLVQKGISAERLSYMGYASSRSVAPNASPEGRAKNRRTELVVTGI